MDSCSDDSECFFSYCQSVKVAIAIAVVGGDCSVYGIVLFDFRMLRHESCVASARRVLAMHLYIPQGSDFIFDCIGFDGGRQVDGFTYGFISAFADPCGGKFGYNIVYGSLSHWKGYAFSSIFSGFLGCFDSDCNNSQN